MLANQLICSICTMLLAGFAYNTHLTNAPRGYGRIHKCHAEGLGLNPWIIQLKEFSIKEKTSA